MSSPWLGGKWTRGPFYFLVEIVTFKFQFLAHGESCVVIIVIFGNIWRWKTVLPFLLASSEIFDSFFLFSSRER